MTTYDQNFYAAIRAGCQSSAAVVAPLVHGLLKPATVVDVGCGEGWWAHSFAELGCEVHGLDGDWPGAGQLLGPSRFTAADLSTRFHFDQRHPELVICLEVAEHLPAERAVSFIEDLCWSQPRALLFSAAIPGQPGVGHVNCQWQSYWAALIAAHGYRVTGALRQKLWHDERVEPWYRQNLLLAVHDDVDTRGPLNQLLDKRWAEPFDVVHPEIWRWFH